jgi:NDP-sugar pyrophosphorylase family protein
MKPELLVMAAGLGSRFGGLKQLEPVGPDGERVMDYALFDARRAGVERAVFVIRREMAAEFHRQVGSRYSRWMEVAYAFQDLDQVPEGFRRPGERTRPWGTAHAILAARTELKAPFLAINADDFYGRTAFELLAGFLARPGSAADAYAMVAFRMANTLSEHGPVARGICQVDPAGLLRSVTEHTGLERDGDGCLERDAAGDRHFTGLEPVSMNIWGFRPGIFAQLQERFARFLAVSGQDPRAEFFIPTVVDALVREGQATVRVLDTPDRWFGVTYREDKAAVVARLQDLVAAGVYPPSLWS